MAYPTYGNDDLYTNKICSTCGTNNDPDSMYCIGCGCKLSSSSPVEDIFTPPIGGGITCPKCGANNDSDSLYCVECGEKLNSASTAEDIFTPIGEGITCPKCGANNDSDSLYCIECGEKLNSTSPAEDIFTPIGEGITCPKCGANNDSDSLYCIECGEKLNNNITDNFINDELERCPNCRSIIDPLTGICGVCHYNKNDSKEYSWNKGSYNKTDETFVGVTSTVKKNTSKIEITDEIKEANSNFKPASSFDD